MPAALVVLAADSQTIVAATMNPNAEILVAEWTWKTEAMRRMAAAVLRVALEHEQSGADYFSANDLPEFEHGGPGIAGSIFRILKDQGLIERVFAGGQPQFVYNAGHNPVGLYRLKNARLARALLARHGAAPQPRQLELLQGQISAT